MHIFCVRVWGLIPAKRSKNLPKVENGRRRLLPLIMGLLSSQSWLLFSSHSFVVIVITIINNIIVLFIFFFISSSSSSSWSTLFSSFYHLHWFSCEQHLITQVRIHKHDGQNRLIFSRTNFLTSRTVHEGMLNLHTISHLQRHIKKAEIRDDAAGGMCSLRPSKMMTSRVRSQWTSSPSWPSTPTTATQPYLGCGFDPNTKEMVTNTHAGSGANVEQTDPIRAINNRTQLWIGLQNGGAVARPFDNDN